MKKLKIMLLSIIAIFMLTGCGTDLSKEVAENMNNVESGEVIYDMNMKMSAEGVEVTIPLEMELKFYQEEKIHLNMSTSVMGESLSMEMYGILKDNTATIYTNSSDLGTDWYKTTGDVEETQINEANSFIELYNKMYDVKEISESDLDKNIVAYKGFLKANDAIDLLNSSGTEYDYNLSKDIEVKIYLNKSTKYVEKLVIDFKDAVSVEVEGIEFKTEISITMSFKSLNQITDFEIPKEVLEAKEM